VLIVDDERDLAQLIEFNLRQDGFDPRIAMTGQDALRMSKELKPELVLLDVMLPDMSGLEETTRDVPVVMLTACGEEMDRVAGFEIGADDYVVKPFSVRELVLRLKAILRRGTASEPTSPPLRIGKLRIEPTTHRCFVEELEVQLTVLEFRLVKHLMTRQGRVQTRDQLLEHVWGITSPLETRTIDTHVMRLREKLGPARHYVETVRGVGYRMLEPGSDQ
jgi:two-component system phosphate regulon response regulator PhoB